MNHYAKAKTEDVLEILSWARAWQLRMVPILALSRSPSESRKVDKRLRAEIRQLQGTHNRLTRPAATYDE